MKSGMTAYTPCPTRLNERIEDTITECSFLGLNCVRSVAAREAIKVSCACRKGLVSFDVCVEVLLARLAKVSFDGLLIDIFVESRGRRWAFHQGDLVVRRVAL